MTLSNLRLNFLSADALSITLGLKSWKQGIPGKPGKHSNLHLLLEKETWRSCLNICSNVWVQLSTIFIHRGWPLLLVSKTCLCKMWNKYLFMKICISRSVGGKYGKDSSQKVIVEETLSKVNWQNKVAFTEDDLGVWNQSYPLVPKLVADRFEEVLPSG